MANIFSCPFLTFELKTNCRAASKAYEPSSFEREEYCRTARHSICPFFCVSTGGRYPAGGRPAMRKRVGGREEHSTD